MRITGGFNVWVLVAGIALLAGCSRVDDDWKSAQAADSTEAYQDFLQQHGDSEYGVKAQERIKQLAEDRDWQQASTLDTRDAYEQFVAQHADGKWAQEARVRIENFQLAAEPAGGAPAVAQTTAEQPQSAPVITDSTPEVAAKPAATKPVSAAKPAAAKPVAAKPGTASSSYYAQLGAFSSRASAETEWKRLSARYKTELGSLKPRYSAARSQSKTVYRLQVGLGSEQRARDVCAALKKLSQACVPVAG